MPRVEFSSALWSASDRLSELLAHGGNAGNLGETALGGLDALLGLARTLHLNAGAGLDRGGTHAALGRRAGADVAGVDGARDAILLLDVQLGEGVGAGGVDGRGSEVTLGSSLDHVADLELLHSLVLGDAAAAVRATNELGSTTTVAILATITALLGHLLLNK